MHGKEKLPTPIEAAIYAFLIQSTCFTSAKTNLSTDWKPLKHIIKLRCPDLLRGNGVCSYFVCHSLDFRRALEIFFRRVGSHLVSDDGTRALVRDYLTNTEGQNAFDRFLEKEVDLFTMKEVHSLLLHCSAIQQKVWQDFHITVPLPWFPESALGGTVTDHAHLWDKNRVFVSDEDLHLFEFFRSAFAEECRVDPNFVKLVDHIIGEGSENHPDIKPLLI